MGVFSNLLNLIDPDDAQTPSDSSVPLSPPTDDADSHNFTPGANETISPSLKDDDPSLTDPVIDKIWSSNAPASVSSQSDSSNPTTPLGVPMPDLDTPNNGPRVPSTAPTMAPALPPATNVPNPPPVAGVSTTDTNNTASATNPQQVQSIFNNYANQANSFQQQQNNPGDVGILGNLSAWANLKDGFTKAKGDIIDEQEKQFTTKQMNDPNSPASKIVQQALSKLPAFQGQDLSKLTAQQGMQVAPGFIAPLMTMYGKQNQQAAQNSRFQTGQENRFFTNLDKEQNPFTSSNPSMKAAQNVIMNSDRLSGLALDKNGNVQNVTPTQFTELAGSLARMVQGGQVGIGSLKEFLPGYYGNDAASLGTYLTGHPELADNKALVGMMYNTAQREQQIARNQIKDANINTLANASDTGSSINKDKMVKEANKLGVPPESFEDGSWKNYLSGGTNQQTPNQNQQQSGNVIKVINPQNKSGTIPASQLQKALAQGYKQVG